MKVELDWLSIILGFVEQAPIWLVLLVGAVMMVVRWRRHPRVSLLGLLGFVGLLVVQFIAYLFWSVAVPLIIGSIDVESFNWIQRGARVVISLLRLVFVVALIGAVFLDRFPKRPDVADQDPDDLPTLSAPPETGIQQEQR